MQQYTETNKKIDEIYNNSDLKELIDAGVFLGRKKSKTHPRMKQYILVSRNDFEIINLNKTIEKLEEAKNFIKEKLKEGGNLLFVGSQISAEGLLQDLNKEIGCPIVNNRWIGGLLTNFDILLKRINFFKKLRTDIQNGLLDKYTKKEKVKIQKEFNKLEKLFGGLESLTILPSVIIIIDPTIHSNAVHEAKKLNIPVVAFINTDGNPDLIDFPVPGNTRSSLSINWFLNNIKQAFLDARNLKQNILNNIEKEEKDSQLNN